MTARACKSCNRSLRKGSTRRALVLEPDGSIAAGLVCARCALRAVAFVVPPPTTIAPLCGRCKREPAAVCGSCFTSVSNNVIHLSAANAALLLSPQKMGEDPK